MIESMVRIRPYGPEDAELLRAAAVTDKHIVVAPTFVVEKDGKIVGYLGIATSVLVWMDTEQTNVRDSANVLNFFENFLAMREAGIIQVPVVGNSPYLPFMEKVGYSNLGSATMFFKNLNP